MSPARRLIVPRGHGAGWWGCDFSVRRLSLGFVAPDGRRGARTASIPELRGGARLAAIWSETVRIVSDVVKSSPRFEDGQTVYRSEFPWPGVVLVEQPGGKSLNHPLEYACGVIQGAIHYALWRELSAEVVVDDVVPAHWKLVACGRGDIYKPDPKRGRPGPYGVLVWAQANGYRGTSWDEADALGIAECARREVALEVR